MKQSYRVTEKAGRRVNGQRVVAGQIVTMSEGEARYYLDLQELEPVKALVPIAQSTGSKR
ncbi:hypothetical protein [Bosea sp. (in: a-proteobacteria)]